MPAVYVKDINICNNCELFVYCNKTTRTCVYMLSFLEYAVVDKKVLQWYIIPRCNKFVTNSNNKLKIVTKNEVTYEEECKNSSMCNDSSPDLYRDGN